MTKLQLENVPPCAVRNRKPSHHHGTFLSQSIVNSRTFSGIMMVSAFLLNTIPRLAPMTGGRGLGRYLILTETTAHFILRPGVER